MTACYQDPEHRTHPVLKQLSAQNLTLKTQEPETSIEVEDLKPKIQCLEVPQEQRANPQVPELRKAHKSEGRTSKRCRSQRYLQESRANAQDPGTREPPRDGGPMMKIQEPELSPGVKGQQARSKSHRGFQEWKLPSRNPAYAHLADSLCLLPGSWMDNGNQDLRRFLPSLLSAATIFTGKEAGRPWAASNETLIG